MNRRHLRIVQSLAATAAFTVAGNLAQANLIANGDFSSNAAGFANFPGYALNVQYNNPYADSWNPTDGSGDVFGYQGVNGTDTGVGTPFGPASLDIYNDNGVDTGNDVANFAFLQSNSGAGNTFPAFMRQNIEFLPDTEYVLSFVIAARSGSTDGGYDSGGNIITVLYSDDAGVSETTIASYTQDNGEINGAYFTQYIVNFTTDADAGAGYLQFLNPNTNESLDQTVAFSNVLLDVVPEPASLALLGLGALAVAARNSR